MRLLQGAFLSIDVRTEPHEDTRPGVAITCHRSTAPFGLQRIVTAAGEIDASNHEGFTAALDAIVTAAPPGIVLDLTGIAFIWSAGLAALADFALAADAARIRWALCAPEAVTHLLGVLELDQNLAIYDTVENAALAINSSAATPRSAVRPNSAGIPGDARTLDPAATLDPEAPLRTRRPWTGSAGPE